MSHWNMRYALHLDMFEATLTCSRGPAFLLIVP